jgi:RNA polymerase sigma-70 factor (TIGR02960 family)
MSVVQDSPLTVRLADDELEGRLEQHRAELTAYCYRMLGSPFEAEDAVQDTLIRAWRNLGRFEGRAALRSWLYRIATNVCLDMLKGRERRARPMDLGPAGAPVETNLNTLPETTWIQPIPDGLVAPEGDPADVAVARETVRLAFVAALQHLPARQRAVLILCEVLRWQASEVAELLDTSVASVNSALQRARATLADALPARRADWTTTSLSDEERDVLARFIDAHERQDASAAAAMLRDDTRITMPPAPMMFEGKVAIARSLETAFGPESDGDWRLVPTVANRLPTAASYLRVPGDDTFRAFKLDVIRVVDGLVAEVTTFGPRLFPEFGLPATLDE